MKLAHLINPIGNVIGRDLEFQQPLALESLRIAGRMATDSGIDVETYACFYPEDENAVPDWMQKLPPLQESTSGKFKVERKLPYFREMLNLLCENSDADYFVQTNADIIVSPHFYLLLKHLIEKEARKCFSINKRIVPENMSTLPLIWSTLGAPHNGLDCFVFPREFFSRFVLGEIVMGTPWSETTLAASMISCDNDFLVFRSAAVTYHLGDRRTWLARELDDYREHNVSEFARVLKVLSKTNKKVLKHSEIQIFLWKMWQEAGHYEFQDKHIRYWIDRGYGKNIHEEYKKRLVGYNQ